MFKWFIQVYTWNNSNLGYIWNAALRYIQYAMNTRYLPAKDVFMKFALSKIMFIIDGLVWLVGIERYGLLLLGLQIFYRIPTIPTALIPWLDTYQVIIYVNHPKTHRIEEGKPFHIAEYFYSF